jgi:hypothetical protein
MLLKLLPYLAMSAAGWFGWWLGRHVGLFTAYIVSILAAAAGLYYGRRLAKQVLGEI